MKTNIIVLLLVLSLTSCSEQQARRPVAQRTATVLSETIVQKKELIAQENAYIEEYLAKDTNNTFIASTFGFWYRYVVQKENSSKVPAVGDEVSFSYSISGLNGTVLYSEEELGLKTYKVDKEDFIPALQEGIKLMKVGETVQFIIPSYRGFGLVGDGQRIGINQTLKSTVTLLNIKDK